MKRHTERWFLNRIGKRLRRTGGTCSCNDCYSVRERGIYIHDTQHAKYLKLCQDEMGLKYQDWSVNRPV